MGNEEMEELKLVDREEDAGTSLDLTAEVRPSSEVRTRSVTKRNPPARNTSRFWFERFLAVIQRQNPSVIDQAFLSQIAPSNEGNLLAQLKFLGVVDEQGRRTDLLSALNMVGEEQRRGFERMARESYGDLLSELKVDKAVPDDLVNFFIRKYAFTRDKAVNASKFFLYLAEKGAFPVSSDLSSFLTEKPAGNGGSTQATAPARVAERVLRTPAVKLAQRKSTSPVEGSSPAIQATISIKLDKDTPREYWDRVLALLGERKSGASFDVQVNGDSSQEEADTSGSETFSQ